MAVVEVEAIVATTHVVPKYGGIRLAPEALQGMAEALRSGEIPMAFNHDLRRRIGSEVVSADVRERDDGEHELHVIFRVDEAEWQRYQDEIASAGAPGGMSFTTFVALGKAGGTDDSDPAITIAGDAEFFTETEIAGRLPKPFCVHALSSTIGV